MRAGRVAGLAAAWVLACAACGGSDDAALTSAGPPPTASPVPATTAAGPSGASAAPAGEAVLAFDDGSPGRLTAVRGGDGSTTATLELDTSGAAVTKVGLSAANHAADVTGIEVPLAGSGGTWTGQALLPLPGAWTFEVTVQRDDGGFLTDDLANVTVTL